MSDYVALRARALENASNDVLEVGLSALEIGNLAVTHRFDLLASLFPTRGTVDQLKKVAWYGSAVGDIACSVQTSHRVRLLTQAAVFNVAVALFDTVVDDVSEKLHPVCNILSLTSLSNRLRSESSDPVIAAGDETLAPLANLFEYVLANVGVEYRGDSVKMNELVDLLTQMYESEIGATADRTAAKTLPVVFIGAIVDTANRKVIRSLFESLGAFLCLLDDWQDLHRDLIALKPNSFLGRNQSGPALIGYCVKCCYRLAGGRASHLDIERTLFRQLENTLVAAAASEIAYSKTISFFRHLLDVPCFQ